VFIVRSAHPTINPTSITDAAFITGTTNFAHGSVRIDQVSTHPEVRTKVGVACSSVPLLAVRFWVLHLHCSEPHFTFRYGLPDWCNRFCRSEQY
jgi:hypothetical protein